MPNRTSDLIVPITDWQEEHFLSSVYQMPAEEREEVGLYLTRHPHLVAALKDIHTQLSIVFTTDLLHISLVRFRDHEEGVQWLSVRVFTVLPPRDAVKRLAAFDEWWIDQEPTVRAHITITAEPL